MMPDEPKETSQKADGTNTDQRAAQTPTRIDFLGRTADELIVQRVQASEAALYELMHSRGRWSEPVAEGEGQLVEKLRELGQQIVRFQGAARLKVLHFDLLRKHGAGAAATVAGAWAGLPGFDVGSV